jgi:hypothetical protein
MSLTSAGRPEPLDSLSSETNTRQTKRRASRDAPKAHPRPAISPQITVLAPFKRRRALTGAGRRDRARRRARQPLGQQAPSIRQQIGVPLQP